VRRAGSIPARRGLEATVAGGPDSITKTTPSAARRNQRRSANAAAAQPRASSHHRPRPSLRRSRPRHIRDNGGLGPRDGDDLNCCRERTSCGAGLIRDSRTGLGHDRWLRRRTRVVRHQEGRARNADLRLAARTLGTHAAAGHAFEVRERGVAARAGLEPRVHVTSLVMVTASRATLRLDVERTAPLLHDPIRRVRRLLPRAARRPRCPHCEGGRRSCALLRGLRPLCLWG